MNNHNPLIEATWTEESLIASCMLEKETALQIADALKPEQFYSTKNQIIFKAISDLLRSDSSVDLLGLSDHLRSAKKLDQIGGAVELAEYLDRIPQAVNVESCIQTVLDKSSLRLAIKAAKDTLAAAMNGSQVDEVLGIMHNGVKTVEDQSVKTKALSYADNIELAIENAERIHNLKHEISGVPSGIYALDYITAGLQDSDLVILAGRPAMGKSALAVNYSLGAAKCGFPVVFYSLEMSKLQLTNRTLADEANIDLQKFRKGGFTADEWNRMVNAQESLSGLPLHIVDNPHMTVSDIRGSIRQFKRDHGAKLVVIDYLGLITPTHRTDRHLEVSEITRSLKLIAKELDIPILLLAQLNRKCEDREDKRPRLSDLKESGGVEENSDVVMFVYRGIVYGEKEGKPEKAVDPRGAEIIIEKQRNGPIGVAKIGYDPEYTRFRSLNNDNF